MQGFANRMKEEQRGSAKRLKKEGGCRDAVKPRVLWLYTLEREAAEGYIKTRTELNQKKSNKIKEREEEESEPVRPSSRSRKKNEIKESNGSSSSSQESREKHEQGETKD